MGFTSKINPSIRLTVFTLLIFTLGSAVEAFGETKRVALVINVAVGDSHREFSDFKKLRQELKTHFDQVIIGSRSDGDFIPDLRNVKKVLKSFNDLDFLFVYYLGYGKRNRIAFGRKYLSRNVFRTWIEDVSTGSFTIMDVLPLSSAYPGKKTTISSLKNISANSSHYYLLNRQKDFLTIFEKIISASHKTDLGIKMFYESVRNYHFTNIGRDISLLEMIPEPEFDDKLIIAFKSAASQPETIIESRQTTRRIDKTTPTKKIKAKIPPPNNFPQKTVVKKRIQGTTPVEANYFKAIDFKAKLGVYDIQRLSKNRSSKIEGQKIVPFLSGSILFGINVTDGSVAWKIPIDRRLSEYGMSYVDGKYIFILLQNVYDGYGLFKIIKRASGVEINSVQIWGNLTYYQSYQQPFVTAKVGENYFSFLVLRKPDRTSEVRKIVFNPKTNQVSLKNYDLNYQITSPLGYRSDLASIYWGGKNGKTNKVFLGQLELFSDVKKDYVLTADGTDYKDYIIEDPPLIVPNGPVHLPHTLYFFVCLNKKILSPRMENLIAVYQLKRPETLVAESDFPDYKLFLQLVNEKIIRRDSNNSNYVYFDLAIQDEKQLKEQLEGITGAEQVLNIWKKIPEADLQIIRHNLYKFKGRTISSPTFFNDPLVRDLNYVYFFSAIPPQESQSGIKKLLVMFEPYFWQRGVYLGANNYSLPDLAGSNLLGVPLIVKDDADYLMLMASDEVYLYRYGNDSAGLKEWKQDYRYNEAIRKGVNEEEPFYGISNSPIRRVGNNFLIKSTHHDDTDLYAFRLLKTEKTGYKLELSWVFKGGEPINAPLTHTKGSDELSIVSGNNLLGLNVSVFDRSLTEQSPVSQTSSVPVDFNIHKNVFAKAVVYKQSLYWISSGVMFIRKIADSDALSPAEKFSEVSKKIVTGISFRGDKFSYGTENNGVEIYNLNKDSFYPFFKLEGRVSSTPVMDEDMIYFATESEDENYLYALKLDNENFFMLPNPGWDVQDKTYSSPDSWRFRIKDAKILSPPVLGQIGNREVVFAGTTGGIIYAFERKGGKNKTGELKKPSWSYKLRRIDEGITSPLIFDWQDKILYCMSNKGRLYILNPARGTEAVVFTIPETDDYRDFKPTAMTLSEGNLCFSVSSKRLTSVFYYLNYKSGKYIRVSLPKEAIFEPLVVNNKAYVSCRSGEIYNIELPALFSGEGATAVSLTK